MKFKQFLRLTESIDVAKIHEFLSYYGIDESRYNLTSQGEICLKCGIDLQADSKINGQLPDYIKFKTVNGDFNISDNALLTLKGCPKIVRGDFRCSNNYLVTLEGGPTEVYGNFDCGFSHKLNSIAFLPKMVTKDLNITGTAIKSLVGIHDIVKEMNMMTADWQYIKSGGLGLVLYPNGIDLWNGRGSGLTKPFKIIEKYLGFPDRIFECQNELIEAGYEENAKL